MNTQIHETQNIPNRLKLNRATMRHIIMKLSKSERKKEF